MQKIIISCKKLDNLEKNFWNIKIKDFDFLEIKPILTEKKIEIIRNYKNPFVFTSFYAIKYLENIDFSSKKAYCINGKIKEKLIKLWFEILSSSENSLDLAKNISSKEVLHITTKNKMQDMYDFAKENKIKIKSINSYSKKIKPRKIDFLFDGIIFFSPSQVDSFLKKNILQKEVLIFCIWETTKKYIKERNIKNKIILAEKQNIESIIDEIKKYFN